MPRRRTTTSGCGSLTLPAPFSATFTFSPDDDTKVRITVPPTSKWSMRYHWYRDGSGNHHHYPVHCETLDFLPGGQMELYSSKGVYRNGTISGHTGLHWQTAPSERCAWGLNSHRDHPAGSPDLEVNVVCSSGNQVMWRTVVSATLDAELWPELTTTPAPLRLLLRLIARVPLIGRQFWELIVGAVLWLQLLLVFQRFGYRTWCGHLPLCGLWSLMPWPQMAPEWAQSVEWASADYFVSAANVIAVLVGQSMLGLRDRYVEYEGELEDMLVEKT